MSMITELIERLRESADDTELDMECSLTLDGECNKLLREAADVIEELSTKLQAANMERSSQYYNGGWIPVSERLPEWGEEVLTINNDGNYEINHIIDDERNEWFNDDDIVAWMPLPKPYKAESEE